ncbi:MAG: hypothetical protein H0T54_07660 [Geodermatophilaceae bacterium]|nr:hypothetical protein [Geodermatophilaceae bacterium]
MSVAPDSAQDRLARKRSLSRRGFAYRLLGAIGLILLTLEIGDRPALELSEILCGLAAIVAVVGAVDAGMRAYRINVGSQARPKIAVIPLPHDRSLAFAPLVRLASRERELAEHVAALPADVSADTWRQASAAARTLRTHAARITAAEGRGPTKNGSSVDLLASRLREGVSAYERLTVTAAELAGHDSDTTPPKNATLRLADATDALVGMMRGLSS